MKRVLDAVIALLDGKDMEHSHRLSQLQQVMAEVTQQLTDPDILTNLNEMKDKMEFWSTVDLKQLVHWRVQQVSMM